MPPWDSLLAHSCTAICHSNALTVLQVCWDKFCRYFDVEQRKVPVAEGRYCATAELMESYIDENTIGESTWGAIT